MSYVRSLLVNKIKPEVVQACSQMYGVSLPREDLDPLAISLSDQLASLSLLERLDLTEIAPILRMDPRWHE